MRRISNLWEKSIHKHCVVPRQSVCVKGVVTESKPVVKRNLKTGKKPGGKNGKEGSKKNLSSTGKSAFHNNKKLNDVFSNALNYPVQTDLSSIYSTL